MSGDPKSERGAGEASSPQVEREVAGLWCRDVLGALTEYVAGSLEASRRAQLEAHVRGCPLCERFGGEFSDALRALRGTSEDNTLDEDVLARLEARLEGARR